MLTKRAGLLISIFAASFLIITSCWYAERIILKDFDHQIKEIEQIKEIGQNKRKIISPAQNKQLDIEKDLAILKKDRISAQISIYVFITQTFGSIFLVITAALTVRNIKGTEQTQIFERFRQASGDLNKSGFPAIAGIYTLDQIIKDSGDEYDCRVINVLISYIKEKSPVRSNEEMDEEHVMPCEIQKAIELIGKILKKRKKKKTFDRIILSHVMLDTVEIHGFNFVGFNFQNTSFCKANFIEAGFRNCNFNGSNMRHINCSENVDFSDSSFEAVNFEHSHLQRTNFSNSDLLKVNLSHCNLIESNFLNANLTQANLTQTDLIGANLKEATLNGVILDSETDLLSAKLIDVKGLDIPKLVSTKNWQKAIYSTKFFSNENLSNASAREAHFSKLNFNQAILSQVDFSEANLSECIFNGAYMDGVKLKNACIRKASFLNVIGLTVNEVLTSKGWESAIFNDDFLEELQKATLIGND